jgi:Tfp pilus assembly protein PilV
MSLVELLVGMTILAVGMGSALIMFTTAIMNNGRSRSDTTGTMLAQTVLEKIASQPANSSTTFTVTDCTPGTPVDWTVATAGTATPGNGANIDTTTGGIDFTQSYSAVPNNYKMQFASCARTGQQVVFDVRWNVTTISGSTRLVTVSARPQSMSAGNNRNSAILYAQPVTLRTIGGL